MLDAEADPSPEAVPTDASPPDRESQAGGQPPSIRVWALCLAAGLIAGLASWVVGEVLHERVQPPPLITTGVPSVEDEQAYALEVKAATTLEASLAFGSLGAALGLALGAAGGAARRSVRAASTAAAFGAVLGAAVGAAMPRLLLPIYFRFYAPNRDDLILAILIQAGICSLIGAFGGVAFGVGLGDRGRVARAIVGGLLGAIAGVLVYEMAGALAFPLDETTKPISASWGSRLLARLSVAVLTSAGAASSALPAPRTRARRPPGP